MSRSSVLSRSRRGTLAVIVAVLAVLAPACSKSLVRPPAAATAAVGAITPIAECYSALDSGLYFGYRNDNTTPVVIPEGDANRLSGNDSFDNPMLTTLFAPGEVTHAFWTYDDGDGGPVEWSLTGPDGVTRTASTASESLPACENPITVAGDTRQPVVDATAELSADGTEVTFDVTLTGVPATSVCNGAFTAEPALVGLGDGSALPTGYETTATVTLPLRDPILQDVTYTKIAELVTYGLVVDRCSYDGTTVTSWPAPTPIFSLAFGSVFCAELGDDGTLTTFETAASCELSFTGGSPSRPH